MVMHVVVCILFLLFFVGLGGRDKVGDRGMNKVFVNRQAGVNCVRYSIVWYMVGPK